MSRPNAITPFNDIRGREEAGRLTQIGTTHVKRMAFSVTFRPDDWSMPMELWVDNPRDIENHLRPHDEVEFHIRDFLHTQVVRPVDFLSGEIMQDEQDVLYLIINPLVAQGIRRISNSDKASDYDDLEEWKILMRRYGISKMIGDIDPTGRPSTDAHRIQEPEFVLGIDLIGMLRENRYLLDFARRYNMINTQFCRFRAIIRSHHEAMMPIVYYLQLQLF